MQIKVCGMQQPHNIAALREVEGVNYMGFIFYAGSARFAEGLPPETVQVLPDSIRRVGVFVNASEGYIKEQITAYGLHLVQLHGTESPAFCKAIQRANVEVIKAFSISTSADFEQTEAYQSACQYLLFDTKSVQKDASGNLLRGGTGEQFDWSILSHYTGETPFFLSGGIAPADAESVRTLNHPRLHALDLNSRFETAPGTKDVAALNIFINKITDSITPKKQNNMSTDTTTNRIQTLFATKPSGILSVYFTAGFPTLTDTRPILRALQHEGVDLVEIGIPFSDPMADGVVIQQSSTEALRNGMTLRLLFDQLQGVRDEIHIPLILMGYLNPIMQYGFDAFCQQCAEVGVDGVIIPDLPFAEYRDSYQSIAERHNIHIIMLITPETTPERIELIDQHTSGFIYMVSTASTTGAQQRFSPAATAYFERINAMNLRNPRLIGFGISNRETFTAAQSHAAGAIIGSKFVKLLESEDTIEKAAKQLMYCIR
jgi:tryptophan synthase alpha subunit